MQHPRHKDRSSPIGLTLSLNSTLLRHRESLTIPTMLLTAFVRWV